MPKREEDEKEFAEAQKLIAQSIVQWVLETLRDIESFQDMIELVTLVYVDDDAQLGMLGAIEIWKTQYDFPWMDPDLVKAFDLVSRWQFKKFREQKLNLTQTALSTPLEELVDRRQRMGMKDNYFALGVAPDGCGLITGPKGVGKSSFVSNEFIIPNLDNPNMIVVHNMNLIDPVEKIMEDWHEAYLTAFNYFPFLEDVEDIQTEMDYDSYLDRFEQREIEDMKPGKYYKDGVEYIFKKGKPLTKEEYENSNYGRIDIKDVSKAKVSKYLDQDIADALDMLNFKKINRPALEVDEIGFNYWEIQPENKNAVKLKGRCFYASSIDDALRIIVRHALKGINETGHPYPSIWIVDEAGISRGKQRSMENRLLFHKYITLLSRKLGCFELSIYQLEDAPKELEAFSTHKFHKPSRKRKGYVDSKIDSTSFFEKAYIKGVLDWDERKKLGMPYIEFSTYDIATMVSSFDIRALLDDVNQLTKDGKPVTTKIQFERILSFIDRAQTRVSKVLNRDEILIFILRNQHHYKQLYQLLNEKSKLTPEEQIRKKKYKMLKSDETAVDIAKAELPMERWYKTTLRDEFKRIKKLFPECLDWIQLPDDSTIKDTFNFLVEQEGYNMLDQLEQEVES
jgi:hypothetical protein